MSPSLKNLCSTTNLSPYTNQCPRSLWIGLTGFWSCIGDSIDDFQIRFFLADLTRYSRDIDGWLNFALRKKVKRLSVDLSGTCIQTIFNSLTPEAIIKGCQGVDTTLLSLCLKYVHVTGESVEYLLSVFRSLEDLSMSHSSALEDLTVSGPSLKLKHLEIWDFRELRRLHIHHVNTLVSFKYNGRPGVCVTIQETPRLVNLSIDYEKDDTVKILTQVPRMETLQLYFKASSTMERAPDFPRLRKLKQLELVMRSSFFNCRLCVALLLEASPSLTELKIRSEFLRESDEEKEVKRLEHPHQHLKDFELHGFIGCQLDIGAALYIIENTQSLEKLIIDTSDSDNWDWNSEPEKGEAARTFARQHLEPRLPSGTELVVR